MLIEDPLRKGAEEAERGFHVITGGRGGLHKQWAHFHFTLGVGESSWTQTPVIV